jgi:amino acid adenylation domain-containing protein
LTWIFSHDADGLRARLEYDTELFDQDTIERLAENLEYLLEQLAQRPSAPALRMPLLQELRSAALFGGNDDPPPTALAEPVQGMFERFASQSPASIALLCGPAQLSYAEVNSRANRLARYLRAAMTGAEAVVAVCLPRGIDCPVAMLATLKAGGVYLPVDPEAPTQHIAFLLEQARPCVLVTTSRLAARIVQSHQAEVFCVDQDHGKLAHLPDHDLALAVSPNAAAYCIFTSGSTGRPKGVLVSVAALAGHIAACIDAYGVSASDRVLQFASNAFDTSIEQILATLCACACLVLRGDAPWTFEELVGEVRAQAISVLDIPVAYWHLLASSEAAVFESSAVRLILVGGEAVIAKPVPTHLMSIRALNAYGPTEATITCMMGPLNPVHHGRGPFVPIGSPLGNTRIYLLDEWQDLVPQGAAGEIYIAGPRVARGYLDNPELTAERFVPDPFGHPGTRMYRTGDLGRMLRNGQVEFLGRCDNQVKIRGFRVEPGEIDAALLRHPSVGDAVVVATGREGEKRLLACVVAREPSLREEDLRKHLQEALPAYMQPDRFQFLEKIPLTRNGKVDRQSLEATAAQVQNSAASTSIPESGGDLACSPVLKELLDVVANLGGNRQVGPDVVLQDAGFDSVLLIRLAAQCKRRMGVEIGMRQIIRARTARSIAQLIQEHLQRPSA